jgi:hypothetical protein
MNNIIYKSDIHYYKDKIIIGNYTIFPKRLIGKGSYENIYFGYNLIDLQEVAIKFKSKNEIISTSSIEVKVLKKRISGISVIESSDSSLSPVSSSVCDVCLVFLKEFPTEDSVINGILKEC